VPSDFKEFVVPESAMKVVLGGRVQGVGFRAWTRRWAEREGLRGWVRNRPDGRVEVHAAGPEEALARFAEALEEGPRAARVREVKREDEAQALPDRGSRFDSEWSGAGCRAVGWLMPPKPAGLRSGA